MTLRPPGSRAGQLTPSAGDAPAGYRQGARRSIPVGQIPRSLQVLARRRPWLLAWLSFAPMAILRAGELSEADTFWEIRTGLITISHRALPTADTFSWTMPGKPWTLNSWGFNVVIAVAYRIAGLPAVAWLCAGATMLIAALALTLARELGATPAVAGAGLLLATPLLIGWLTARPQLADYIAYLLLILLLRRITSGKAWLWAVLAVGAVSAIWVNLHSASLLGVAVAGGCTLVLLPIRSARLAGWRCLAAAATALAGSLANPYGIGLIAQTEQVRAASAGIMAEWQHLSPASPIQDLALGTGLIALAVAFRRRDVVLVISLAATAVGGLVAIRMLPFLDVLAIPVLTAWASSPGPVIAGYARSRRDMFIRAGAAGWLALAVVAVPSLTHIGRPDPARYPLTLIRQIPVGCHLFNTDILGGFVILERPDVLVSLDTRNTLYGRQRLAADERVLAGTANLRRGLAGAGCVLVPPDSGLARRLAGNSGWVLRGSQPPAAVLFVRQGTGHRA